MENEKTLKICEDYWQKMQGLNKQTPNLAGEFEKLTGLLHKTMKPQMLTDTHRCGLYDDTYLRSSVLICG